MKILLLDLPKWSLQRKVYIGLIAGSLSLLLVYAIMTLVAYLVHLIVDPPPPPKHHVTWVVPTKK